MKNFLVKTGIALSGVLAVSAMMTAVAMARDGNETEHRARLEEHRQEMAQRRADYLANHPEAAERMEARRREREAFLADNPEAAARMAERRAGMRERVENGEGRPRGPHPAFDGRRSGPPPGGPRFRGQEGGRGPFPGRSDATPPVGDG